MIKFQDFNPTKDMIDAANDVVLARAFIETIQPTVEQYQLRILKSLDFINIHTSEIITELKDVDFMSDEQFSIYNNACTIAAEEAGFNVKPGQCPLATANLIEKKAKQSLIVSMEPVTQIPANDFLYVGSYGSPPKMFPGSVISPTVALLADNMVCNCLTCDSMTANCLTPKF